MPKLRLSNRTTAASLLLLAGLVPTGMWVVLLTTPGVDFGFASYAFSDQNEYSVVLRPTHGIGRGIAHSGHRGHVYGPERRAEVRSVLVCGASRGARGIRRLVLGLYCRGAGLVAI